jgi:hypothetical protein
MVVQKSINNLKERPKDERQVVAIGFAGVVVLILVVAWGFFFLKDLRKEQAASGQLYEINQDTGSVPVTQTYQSYDTTPKQDQFGLPVQN